MRAGLSGGIASPFGAAGLLLIDGDRVLLQRRSAHVQHPGTWSVPLKVALEAQRDVPWPRLTRTRDAQDRWRTLALGLASVLLGLLYFLLR